MSLLLLTCKSGWSKMPETSWSLSQELIIQGSAMVRPYFYFIYIYELSDWINKTSQSSFLFLFFWIILCLNWKEMLQSYLVSYPKKKKDKKRKTRRNPIIIFMKQLPPKHCHPKFSCWELNLKISGWYRLSGMTVILHRNCKMNREEEEEDL